MKTPEQYADDFCNEWNLGGSYQSGLAHVLNLAIADARADEREQAAMRIMQSDAFEKAHAAGRAEAVRDCIDVAKSVLDSRTMAAGVIAAEKIIDRLKCVK